MKITKPCCHARLRGLRRAAVIGIGAVGLAGSVGCSGQTSAPDQPAEVSAEDVWLSRIGTGAEQLARVCRRGSTDRVATALCDPKAGPIEGLQDLYRALRLDQPAQRVLAATTHSLGLSARIVSAANPRVLVFANNSSANGDQFEYEEIVATAFTRGEQLVELSALDPATYEYNFYLLRYAQRCNDTRCAPEDLLTEQTEHGWRSWSLYSDEDLQDTPLDCVSCHLPFGAGTRKMLLMRQVVDPWMHWGDFRGGDERLCPERPPEGTTPRVIATADGLDLMRELEGATGTLAGVPVAEVHAAASGANMSDFLVDAENLIRVSPVPPYPYEQLSFPTREVLCERFHDGTSPTWDQGRAESVARGLHQPYYAPDVLGPESRAQLAAGRGVFLRGQSGSAFDVAASLIAPEAASAVGFVPRADDAAPDILRGMCVRCHAQGTDPSLRRAAFDAEALDSIAPATFRAVRERLSLPKTAPGVMPPRRVGELPDWAISRVLDYLRERCAVAGACE